MDPPTTDPSHVVQTDPPHVVQTDPPPRVKLSIYEYGDGLLESLQTNGGPADLLTELCEAFTRCKTNVMYTAPEIMDERQASMKKQLFAVVLSHVSEKCPFIPSDWATAAHNFFLAHT